MRNSLLLNVALLLLFSGLQVAGQQWTPPKTPWGDPDIQGLWPSDKLGYVPLQRPPSFGTRNVLTDEEYAALSQFVEKQLAIDHAAFADPQHPIAVGGNQFRTCSEGASCRDGIRLGAPLHWASERGKATRQASLIVDPPNGRLPPLTALAESAAADRLAGSRPGAALSPDSYEDWSLWDRCITRGVTSLWPASGPNSADSMGNEIVQAPGVVMIRSEMIHEARVVWLDGRPHPPISLVSYMGHSTGHWEGNTLVVETTNFNGRTSFGTDGTNRRQLPSTDAIFTERFTRTSPNTLHYEATINDPKTWTQSWTVAFDLELDPSHHVYEYACHEGNYSLFNALSGAREQERER
jgi:hypothetical protein